MDSTQYVNLYSAYSMNDIGKFIVDEVYTFNAIISPFSYFSNQFWTTSNNCYITQAESTIQPLVLCKYGSTYDPSQNKCLLGQEMLLHFIGNDPDSFGYPFIPGTYIVLTVEAWIFPELPSGDQYIYSHQGWAELGITTTSLLAYICSTQARYEYPSIIQPFVWKHVNYKLYPYSGQRLTVINRSSKFFRCLKE